MLGPQSTHLLRQILETISETEIIIESHRQSVCSLPSFAPYSAFCRLDRSAAESLSSQDIYGFLKENGAIGIGVGDCAKLLRFFDSDEDGYIAYSDFIQIVLPCDNNLLRAQCQKRPYSRVGRFDSLPFEEESGLTRLLQMEIDLIKRVEVLVRELDRQPDYTVFAAFRTIDRYNEGKVNNGNLQDFFRSFGSYLVEDETYAIIRRIDTDGDAKLSFEEFADFFKNQVNCEAPLSKGQTQQSPQRQQKRQQSQGIKYGRPKSVAKNTGMSSKRAKEFATPSKYDINIEHSLNSKYIAGYGAYSGKKSAASRPRFATANTSAVKQTLPSNIPSNNCSPLRSSSPKRATHARHFSYGGSSSIVPPVEPRYVTDKERFHSPLRREAENEILSTLVEQVNFEKELERAKIDMIQKPDFNTYDVFRMFDQNGSGVISVSDLKYGLGDIGVTVGIEEVELFFKRYDKDHDGRLSFSEFAASLIADDHYYAETLNRRQSSHIRVNPYKRDDLFNHTTSQAFRELMRTHFRVESAAEELRQRLSRNPYFNISEAFRACDLNQNGQISKDELRLFMETRGFFVSEQDARSLTKKFDKNGDGRISFAEFVDEIAPKSPGKRRV